MWCGLFFVKQKAAYEMRISDWMSDVCSSDLGTAGTPSLLGLRIAQLYRLGDVSDALQLATPRPPGLKDPVFDQLPVDVALLKGDLPQACEKVAQGLQADASAYWQKAKVLSRYLAKDYAGGYLPLPLWLDHGGTDTN